MSIIKEFIHKKLCTNNLWLISGVLAIYKYQTNDEHTKYNNKIGFNSADNKFLSCIAKTVL